MKYTPTHATTFTGTSRKVFLFVFLFLILAIAACAQFAQEPTPTVVPTAAPTSTPAPSLEDVAGLACQGKAVPGAASFTGDPDATYSIFVANMDGSSSPWNVNLPQALRAKEVADLNAVLCVDAQAPDPESTWECGNYKAVTGESISLKVGRYLLNTRLVSASAGETIFDYQVLGRTPECPETVDTSDPHFADSVLYGDKLGLNDVIDQQLPYFLPKSALIPMGRNTGTADTNWDEGMLEMVSPDARLLASVPIMDQTTVQMWDVSTHSPTVTLKGHSPDIFTITGVAFSPDGKYLASSGCGSKAFCELFLWDTQSGDRLYSLLNAESESIYAASLVFSPDGKKLAAITSGGIALWDAASGERLQTIPLGGNGLLILFTPDGTGLLGQVSQGFDADMKIWNLQNGEVRVDLGTHDPSYLLAFTSDGKFLKALNFSGPENEKQIEMVIFDAQTGKVIEEKQPLQMPKGFSTHILYLFDADQDLLVENHYINRDGSLRVYDLKQGELALTLFAYPGLNGSGTRFSQGYYLPVTHWSGERYLLDIRWLYHLLLGD